MRGVLETVKFRVLFNTSDLGATRKLIGALSWSSSNHPCHCCSIRYIDINSYAGYNPFGFQQKGTLEELLKTIFQHKAAETVSERKRLEQKYGYR